MQHDGAQVRVDAVRGVERRPAEPARRAAGRPSLKRWPAAARDDARARAPGERHDPRVVGPVGDSAAVEQDADREAREHRLEAALVVLLGMGEHDHVERA